MKKHKTVDDFIRATADWQECLIALREIALKAELEEGIKWGMPVYMIDSKNVLGIGGFKNHCCIWFYNGVFLKDPKNMLMNAQEGKTKALRQWRFDSLEEIEQNEQLILQYMQEAIENQKEGKVVKSKPKKLEIPDELKAALEKDKKLDEAFSALSKSYKREYAEYISEAKREGTKQRRLEKIIPMIMDSKGLQYR